MKDIVICCYDIIKENGALTNSTEVSLKQNMEKEEHKNIQAVILQTEETRKRTVKQQKSKKFNYLKYKPANGKTLQANEIVVQQAALNFLTQMLWSKISIINQPQITS